MPTYHVRAATMCLLFLAGFCLLILMVGIVEPVNTTLSGFVEGCTDSARLCWYGIVTGETLLDNAQQILSQAGYRLVEDSLFDEDAVFSGQYHTRFKRLP